MSNNIDMTTKKSWQEFKDTGLLWWINTILHTFGWAIVVEKDDDVILDVYPARVKFRGFDSKIIENGYIKITEYLKNNVDELLKEAKDE